MSVAWLDSRGFASYARICRKIDLLAQLDKHQKEIIGKMMDLIGHAKDATPGACSRSFFLRLCDNVLCVLLFDNSLSHVIARLSPPSRRSELPAAATRGNHRSLSRCRKNCLPVQGRDQTYAALRPCFCAQSLLSTLCVLVCVCGSKCLFVLLWLRFLAPSLLLLSLFLYFSLPFRDQLPR